MLYVDICLILVLSLWITAVGVTKTKQLISFAILLVLEVILRIWLRAQQLCTHSVQSSGN